MFPSFSNGLGNWGVPAVPTKFQQYFRCYPVTMMPGKERENVNYGGKIVLPPSALHKLSMLHITYPMLFEITSEDTQKATQAGVLEFIAEEGRAYLPQWMMQTLSLEPGSLVQIGSIDLPLGSFVRIEPQSTDFLDIYDPKAVLENALSNFSTLTVGDIFQISYNNRIYSIKVLEVKPESAHHSICVVETDLEVDFAPPVGYVEPSPASSAASRSATASRTGTPIPGTSKGAMSSSIGYEAMLRNAKAKGSPGASLGAGQKLSGRSLKASSNASPAPAPEAPEGENLNELLDVAAPPLSLPFGQLFFGYPYTPLRRVDEEKSREESESSGTTATFQGAGQSLRQSRKRKQQGNVQGSPEVIEID